jgi:RNA polymerase sigma factor (sigma-70 family)
MTTRGTEMQRQSISESAGADPAEKAPPTDRALLQRFASQRDEVAFAALLQRHGPLILRICKRILHHHHDAEDVSQAAFLVLARKAAFLRRPRSVGKYLYKVAYRLACKAQAAAQRRQAHESQAVRPLETDPWAEISLRDAGAAVDEEVARLPEMLRLPVVLYHLEGRKRAEVAQQLGYSADTLDRRLERARELLRVRLTRRGMALSPMLLNFVLGKSTGRMSAEWVAATVQAAVQFAARRSASGRACRAALLAEGVLRTMFLSQVKWASVLVVTLVGLATGGVVACQVLLERAGSPQPQAEESQERNDELHPRAAAVKEEKGDSYGDPLPPGALARLGTVRFRQAIPVHGQGALAFTADGKGLVAASISSPPRLWDVASGKLLCQFQLGSLSPLCRENPILSHDGRFLVCQSEKDKKLHLWELAAGKSMCQLEQLRVEQLRVDPWRCDFSHDCKIIALVFGSGKDFRLGLWETATGRQLWTQAAKGNWVVGLTFSPNDRVIASVTEAHRVVLWDARTGREIRELGPIKEGEQIVNIVFSPTNDDLLVAYQDLREGTRRCSLHLWEAATGKERWQIEATLEGANYAKFLPDGRVIVFDSDSGSIQLREAATGKKLQTCQVGRCYGGHAVVSPEGRFLAKASGPMVHLWDITSDKALFRSSDRGHESRTLSAAFLQDDAAVISVGDDDTVRWWDAHTGRQRQIRTKIGSAVNHERPFQRGWPCLRLSSDGKLLAIAMVKDGEHRVRVRVWDAATGKERSCVELGRFTPYSITLSPDGKFLAAMVYDNISGGRQTVHLWEVATGKHLDNEIEGYLPTFSPDGATLVTWNGPWWEGRAQRESKKEIIFWDVATGGELCRIPEKPATADGIVDNFEVQSMAVSSNCQWLAVADSVQTQLNRLDINLYPLFRSPNSPRLRAGLPSRITFPSMASDYHLTRYAGPEGPLLAFSPDNRLIASSSTQNGVINLLEVASGKVRARFWGHMDWVHTLSFSSEGRRLVSGSSDTTSLVWDATGRLQDDGSLRPLRLSEKELETLWENLRPTDDAVHAGRAIWDLVATGPQAVSLLQRHLLIAKASPGTMEQWIADLDAEIFKTRRQAREELAKQGEWCESALRRALTRKPSLEMRLAIKELLSAVEEGKKTPCSTEVLRRLRAVEVLEHIGTPEARRLLETLSQGTPFVRLAEDSKAALARLFHREVQKP